MLPLALLDNKPRCSRVSLIMCFCLSIMQLQNSRTVIQERDRVIRDLEERLAFLEAEVRHLQHLIQSPKGLFGLDVLLLSISFQIAFLFSVYLCQNQAHFSPLPQN